MIDLQYKSDNPRMGFKGGHRRNSQIRLWGGGGWNPTALVGDWAKTGIRNIQDTRHYEFGQTLWIDI